MKKSVITKCVLTVMIIAMLLSVCSCGTATDEDGASSARLPDWILFRMPKAYIERQIAEDFPLGMSKSDVVAIIDEDREWDFGSMNHGNYYDENGERADRYSYDEEIGSSCVLASISCGIYSSYHVSFAFDENDVLIDVQIEKIVQFP